MKERGGLLADQVDAAGVVDVVDVVPADALGPVLLLHRKERERNTVSQRCKRINQSKQLVQNKVHLRLFFVGHFH